MNTVNAARPVRFLRGDLADKVQARRDARLLAQILRTEALLADCHASIKL